MFEVGNYVFDRNNSVIVITEDNIDKGTYYPIKLTDNILSEFGFSRSEFPFGNSSIKFDDWTNGEVGLNPVSGIHQYQVSFNGKMRIILIKYLHELQNIYLEFTGNELRYNISI